MERSVAVKMGSDIVYVAGTVNGAATDWQLHQGSIWRATVPRSGTGSYDIEITGWDEAGNSSTYRTRLQYGFAAVTDRTLDDVLGRTGKGCYNAEDLNRVGRAVKYLSDLLEEYGYAAPVTARRDWTGEDIPNQGDMAVYLADVRTLINTYCVLPTTPELPESMRKLGYQGANAIEQTLVDIHILILNMAAAWCYSGEIYAGEV